MLVVELQTSHSHPRETFSPPFVGLPRRKIVCAIFGLPSVPPTFPPPTGRSVGPQATVGVYCNIYPVSESSLRTSTDTLSTTWTVTQGKDARRRLGEDDRPLSSRPDSGPTTPGVL